ncbi:MAG: SMI1/KNR4 family protein [Daejeonella sp.]
MIINTNEFGKLSELELGDFEQENSITLPNDYREFLLTYNGGEFTKNVNNYPDTVVTYVLGMHNGPLYASLYKHIDIFKNRIPFGSFPIATDPFGNLFLMSLDPSGHGNIYFWDHEGEPVEQDGHYVTNCYFVAYSFSEFINNLK